VTQWWGMFEKNKKSLVVTWREQLAVEGRGNSILFIFLTNEKWLWVWKRELWKMRKWCLEEIKRTESSLCEKRIASIQKTLVRFFSVYKWEVERDQKIRWEIQILLLLLLLLLFLFSFFLSCCIFHSTIFLCYLFISSLFSLFTLTFIYNDTKNSSPLLFFLTFHNLPFHSCIYALIYFIIFIFELIGGGVSKTEIGPHPFYYSIILIKKIISFSSNWYLFLLIYYLLLGFHEEKLIQAKKRTAWNLNIF